MKSRGFCVPTNSRELEAIQYLLPLRFGESLGACLDSLEELLQAHGLRPCLDDLLKLLPAFLNGLRLLATIFLQTPPFLLHFPLPTSQFRLSFFLFDLFHHNGSRLLRSTSRLREYAS